MAIVVFITLPNKHTPIIITVDVAALGMIMILFGPSFDQAGANSYIPRPGGCQFNIFQLLTNFPRN